MNEADFLQHIEEHAWDLTVYDEDNANGPGVKVGLVGSFIFEQGQYNMRPSIWLSYIRYHDLFGQHLKKGYFRHVKSKRYTAANMEKFKHYVNAHPSEDGCEFEWSSQDKDWICCVGDYKVRAVSPPHWFEQVHGTLSNFSFYLPIEEIKQKDRLLALMQEMADTLKPLSATFGLCVQKPFEYGLSHSGEEMQALFLGVGADHWYVWDVDYRQEILNTNWLTVLDNRFVEKLGGVDALKGSLAMCPTVQVQPYRFGAMIQAGDYPHLVPADTALPPEYQAVSRALRPIRFQAKLGDGLKKSKREEQLALQTWAERFDGDDDIA